MSKPTSLPPDSELLALQSSFSQHLRNPVTYGVPEGLDERRVGVYSDLIFHNISALMSEFFPVLKQMLVEQSWNDLIREFFINWRAETPYFPRLAEDFLQFLNSRPGTNHDPEYLTPLAHYEWLELYLFIHEVELPAQPLEEDELAAKPIRLTELAVPAAYQFPVHQIRKDWAEAQTPTYLLVFRDKADAVRFFELSPLAYELLVAIMASESGLNATDWLKQRAQEFGQDEQVFVDFGMDLLRQFNKEHLIYAGTDKQNSRSV